MSLLALATSPSGIGELARTPNPDARLMLAEVSTGLTVAQAAAAPKLYQLRRQFGEPVLVKLLVIILRAFIDSLRVPDKPDAADVLEMADTLAQTYTHDSLKDIILALKEARTNGTPFYQSLDVAKVYELVRAYFERKARFLENQHLDQKAQGASQQAVTIHQLQQVVPHLVAGIGRQITPDHPNAEHLRHKLTLLKQKERRGLITPEEAEQQRHQVQQVTQRQARPDWQPSPEAQQAISQRAKASTRRFAQRHGINPDHL